MWVKDEKRKEMGEKKTKHCIKLMEYKQLFVVGRKYDDED
jgi:hypothetical protein